MTENLKPHGKLELSHYLQIGQFITFIFIGAGAYYGMQGKLDIIDLRLTRVELSLEKSASKLESETEFKTSTKHRLDQLEKSLIEASNDIDKLEKWRAFINKEEGVQWRKE